MAHKPAIQVRSNSINPRPTRTRLPGRAKVGPGRNFTGAQKMQIIQANMARNGGVVVSDDPNDPYQSLTTPEKSRRGVTPSPAEWQIDHITPASKGGENSFSNARVISRYLNRLKSNR